MREFVLFETAAVAGDGSFEGNACAYGTLVRVNMPSVFEPGSFTESLQIDGSRVRILWSHDDARPIGKTVRLRDSAAALQIEGKLSDTADGRMALQLIRDGVCTDLSIGYEVVRSVFVPVSDMGAAFCEHYALDLAGCDQIRRIQQARLYECSIVTLGANAAAKITAVNGQRQWLNQLAAAEAVGVGTKPTELSLLPVRRTRSLVEVDSLLARMGVPSGRTRTLREVDHDLASVRVY
ncbi:MAG: HK97 family phage prohead protease [Candidatus Binatia bacterium]